MSEQKDKCSKCKGTGMGQFYFNKNAPCDTCKGTGGKKLDRPDREDFVEKCMPTIERFEEVEKQVFFPIPKPIEFSATIRIYASTMSREAVRKTIALFPDMGELKKQIDIKRDYAFGESLFGSPEHQAQMQAAVNTYDVVLKLIKDIGGKE